jgi:hypothetical protein
MHYKGFTVCPSPDLDPRDNAEIETILKEQIDMIYAVGLPDEIMTFFQNIPISITPPSSAYNIEPGVYSTKEKDVRVARGLATYRHEPILIHGMLYAYQDQKIDGGYKNPTIETFYDQARARNLYKVGSLMMSNSHAYFASAATTYLYGVSGQEPFRREEIQAVQPEVIQYFKALFGPKAGTYVGSLTP